MKKAKIFSSVLLLVLCLGILGVGIYAAAPANNKISGKIKVNAASSSVSIWAYITEGNYLIEETTRTGFTETLEDILEFSVGGKNVVSEIDPITLTIKVQNNSTSNELGAYFYKGGIDDPAPSEAELSDIRTNSEQDSVQIKDSATNTEFVKQTFNKNSSAYKYLAPDDGDADTTNNIQYLTVTFSLNDLYDKEMQGDFDIVLNIEEYNPNYTDAEVYAGSEQFVKVSSTIPSSGSVNSTSPNGEASLLSATALASEATRTELPENAFKNKDNLKEVVLPTTIQTIKKGAFDGCSSLTNIIVPSSVTKIEDKAFANCSSLKTLELPQGVEVEGNILEGINEISVPNIFEYKDETLTILSGVTSITAHDQLWDAYKTTAKNLFIPKTVTSIEGLTFLSSVTNGEIIEGGAFAGWTALENVVIESDSTLSLKGGVFYGCTSLKNVFIPSGVTLSLDTKEFTSNTYKPGPFFKTNSSMVVYFEGARWTDWSWRDGATDLAIDQYVSKLNILNGVDASAVFGQTSVKNYLSAGNISGEIENIMSALSEPWIEYETNASYSEYLGIVSGSVNKQDKILAQKIQSILNNNITSESSVEDVIKTLEKKGYTYSNMQTEQRNTYLYWVKDTNSVVYANNKDEILFTTHTNAAELNPTTQTWATLTGTIPTQYYKLETVSDHYTTSISNGKQLYKLANDIHDSKTNSPISISTSFGGTKGVVQLITLQNDIDMRGVDLSFGSMGANGTWTSDGGANITPPINTQFTIDGAGYKLCNIYATKDEVKPADPTKVYEKRGSGLIYQNYGTATFNNLTISDSVFGTLDITQSAILVAYNYAATDGGRGTLIANNLTINNCIVYGDCKVGTMIGSSSSGSLIIKGNTTIRNTQVISAAGEAGGVFGLYLETYKFMRTDYTDTSLPSQLNNLGTKFTVENPEALIDETVTVEIVKNSNLNSKAQNYLRLISVPTSTAVVTPSTTFGTQAGLCTSNDVFTMNVPTNGYITAWELEDDAPKGKPTASTPYMTIRGSTAKYGFVASQRYSVAWIKDANGNNIQVDYEGTSYNAALAYAEVAVDNTNDVGKLWCDFFPNCTQSTTNWFV